MITVFTTPTCATCRDVKRYLERHELPYETIDLTENPEIAQNLYETTGVMTVPITTDGTTYVIGYDRAKLRKLNA